MPSTPATTHFQPPPPIRTSTGASQSSASDIMSPGSETFSPSYTPHGRATVASPTETKFFGAIVSRVRGRSRSRSHSRGDGPRCPRSRSRGNGRRWRSRSRSPMLSGPPPKHLSSSPFKSNSTTQGVGVQKPPLQSRHASSGSQSPISPVSRPGYAEGQLPRRTSSDMWRGRHSNEWLFGGWSVRETARDIVRRKS